MRTPRSNGDVPKDGQAHTQEESDPTQQTLKIGRLRTLQRLGLAEEHQRGVWRLDANAESKLRQLGDCADKFKMMQRALKEAGIDRTVAAMALFERGPRKTPLIGKVVGVGMVDEITDGTWVIIDAVDGRVHYADLGRLKVEAVPVRGNIVALAGDGLNEKPSSVPRLHLLSATDLDRQTTYEGSTWLDQAIVTRLGAVDGYNRVREEVELTADDDEASTGRADGGAVHPSEVGDDLEVRDQAASEPHQLDIAGCLTLQSTA